MRYIKILGPIILSLLTAIATHYIDVYFQSLVEAQQQEELGRLLFHMAEMCKK